MQACGADFRGFEMHGLMYHLESQVIVFSNEWRSTREHLVGKSQQHIVNIDCTNMSKSFRDATLPGRQYTLEPRDRMLVSLVCRAALLGKRTKRYHRTG